jgi:hypothetical protein
MVTLSERIVSLYQRKVAGDVDLRKLDITSENLKEVLEGLIAGVDNLDEVEKRLGLDLRNMTKLMAGIVHNDDAHHNGESILVHIGWVLDDVTKLSENFDDETKALLKLTALCHDLGKPYVHKFDDAKKRHTFYDHAATSVEIARVLLAKHKDRLGTLYEHLLDFIRLHDVFYALVNDRLNQPGGSTKYVRSLMRENIYRAGLLKHLLTFAKADSARAKSYTEKLKDFESIIGDCENAEIEARTEAEAAQTAKQLRELNTRERMPEIEALLFREAPEAAQALPDLQAVKRTLGQAKRYDLIKAIEGIIARD